MHICKVGAAVHAVSVSRWPGRTSERLRPECGTGASTEGEAAEGVHAGDGGYASTSLIAPRGKRKHLPEKLRDPSEVT